MPANKNALIRYKTIDNCLRNRYRRWTLEDLVGACSDALYDMEGICKGISVRTVQGDIQMMRSDKLGYNAPIEVYDHKYYRYADEDYSIANMPLSQNDYNVMQEAVDMTYAAFDYAQRDRNPVLILADGVLGTIMEPVELPEMRSDEEVKRLKDELSDWALVGHSADKKALILPGGWAGQEDRCKRNAAMYDTWEKDVQVEEFMTEDAELILVAYGVCGRISKSAVRILRAQGYRVGLIRPKTVSPWPYASFDKLDYSKVKAVLDVEMSIPAQLVLDVTLAVKDRCPVHTCLRSGGEIMSRDHVVAAAKAILDKEGA